MNRFVGSVVFFPLLLLISFATGAQEVPDPFGPSTLQARALRGLTGEIATLILPADPGGELAMEALAVPLLTVAAEEGESDSAKQRVAVFVEIDGTSFLELNQSDTTRLEIYVYALREQGFEIADYRAEMVAVDVGSLGEIVWQSGLKYYGELALAPGTYRLRVLTRNFQSKAAGLREIDLTVPEPDDPLLLTPLLPDPEFREPWIPIRPWSKDLLAGLINEPLEGLKTQGRKPYPFSIGESAIRPAARPVLVPDHPSTLYLHGRIPTAADGFKLLLFDSSVEPKRLLATLPLTLIDRVERDGSALVEARFVPPSDLSPGPMELRVQYLAGPRVDAGSRSESRNDGGPPVPASIVSPATAVHLMDSSVREQNLLWSDLRWRGTGETPAERPSSPDRMENAPIRERGGRKVDKLAREYREILADVTELGTTTTMSGLLDLETRVINEGSSKAAALLQTAEFKFAESLAETDPESLVPLIQLHQDLYLAYRGRRLFSLGTHSRVLMERLAELYAEKGSGQGSKIVAARALTSLAGYLQAGGLASTSQRLYRRALELDPSSKTAMLALGCGYERLGAYGRAKQTLQQLTIRYPDMSVAWLRLAVNTARLGNRLQSRDFLKRVITLDGPDWVRSLAYEELARIHLFLDQVPEALELLEQISEPDEGTLVLIAYLYDRLGRPDRSLELLDQVQARPGQGPSPRKKYDSWPEQELVETRASLLEAARIRLSRLQELVPKDSGAKS